MAQFAVGHQRHLPDSRHWCDAVAKNFHNANSLECPDGPEDQCSYTFNSALGNVVLDQIAQPGRTVLVFDGKGGWNSAGGPELLDFRHSDFCAPPEDHRVTVLFVDGHVSEFKQGQIQNLIWKPILKAQSS